MDIKFRNEIIGQFENLIDQIYAIILKGSAIEPSNMDFWSDIDLLIVLKEEVAFDEMIGNQLMGSFDKVIGSQRYDYDGGITYRVVIDSEINPQWDIQLVEYNIWDQYIKNDLDDSLVVFGDLEIKISESNSQSFQYHYDQRAIEDIWFKFYDCGKKFCRKDNLIGLHLYNGLVNDYLVLLMVDRDVQKQSNAHRFGENESVEELTQLKGNYKTEEYLDALLNLAKCYDEKLKDTFSAYESRLTNFTTYIIQSKKQILR